MRRLLLSMMLIPAAAIAAPQVVAARGHWAALHQDTACEAATRSLNASAPARASLAFDPGGPRHGQFSARLSRLPREGASVMLTIGSTSFLLMSRGGEAWSRGPAQEQAIIAAIRLGGAMKVESRSSAGGRIVDRFSLDGAPLAIDAAAACAARLANP